MPPAIPLNSSIDKTLGSIVGFGYFTSSIRRKIVEAEITIHHGTVYETQWIVDKAAYDEKVLTCYTYTCGATNSN